MTSYRDIIIASSSPPPSRLLRNIEDNDETTELLGNDIDEGTLWRHHDSAWIRVPTRTMIALKDFILRLPDLAEELGRMIARVDWAIRILLTLALVLSILLFLDLDAGGVPVGKAVGLAFTMILLAIYARLQQENNQSR